MHITTATSACRLVGPVVLVSILLAAAVALVPDSDPGAPNTLLVRSAAGVVISGAVISLIAFLGRRDRERALVAVGQPAPLPALRTFLFGALAWLLPAAVTFGALTLGGHSLSVAAPAGEVALTVGLVVLAVLLSEAVPEELVFRGQVLGVLQKRLEAWPAILLQTAIFTMFALLLRGYTGFLDLSMFIAMGIGLGYMRVATDSVWTTVGFHTAFQSGAQLVLTHQVMEFTGTTALAYLAVGTAPFAFAMIAVALLGIRRTSSAESNHAR